MKQELAKMGKKLAFNMGKYMPKALIGISAGATVGSIFLAVQAGMEYQRLKDSEEEITWKDYVRIFGPCAGSGVFSIACAFAGLSKKESQYAAAALMASVYESKEKEIDAKAREIFGDKEVDKMHEEIAKDKLRNAPEPIAAYSGVAFLDLMTGQYIYEDIESIRATVNDLNEHMNNGHDITKAEWCDAFNERSSTGDEYIGWGKSLTGNIKIGFVWEKLPSGRTVAAVQMLTEPRLLYDEFPETDFDNIEIDEYYRQRNPGWSEV